MCYSSTYDRQRKMAKLSLLTNIPSTLRQRLPRITSSSSAAAKQQPAPYHPKNHTYCVGAAFSSDICVWYICPHTDHTE